MNIILDRRIMKYGVIVSVFAIILLSATLLKSVEAFRSNNNQIPNNTPVLTLTTIVDHIKDLSMLFSTLSCRTFL
jgi:hypothetical protein